MNKTGIKWCDLVWNPTRGCSRVSPGCEHCYAERMAARFCGGYNPIADDGLPVREALAPFEGFSRHTAQGPRWTGRVELIESKLTDPLRRRRWAERFLVAHGRKPLVFVDSMSDLFHERLSDKAIHRVFHTMAEAVWFDFVVLTKRAERLLAICQARPPGWVLPHVYLGVSVEDQERYDERHDVIWQLASAGWRTLFSLEPLLGPIQMDLAPVRFNEVKPGWLIIGGESGPHARPCEVAWIRSLRDQAQAAGVPCYIKQDSGPKPGQQGRIPDDLWAVKETPQAACGEGKAVV